MSDKIPMTHAGYNKLKAELDHMKNVEMAAILERLANARAEGDLKENAEYHGARESQGMLQAKINDLSTKLSKAMLIDPSKISTDSIGFGATVFVKDLEFDDEEIFTLVGAGEEDYDVGKILFNSPLAQGLVGKKVGDVAEIEVPQGTVRFEILKISFENE